MHNDLRFFTNEPGRNLQERFNSILKSNTQYFDALVGYFRTSGFYLLCDALQEVEKIRILVGINTDFKTAELIQYTNSLGEFELTLNRGKQDFCSNLVEEMNGSEDSYIIERGINTFIEWLKNGKLEMRLYPKSQIHAKVYIMRKDMSKVPDQYGSVVTGSSNFSKSGLIDNLEFNVELKDSRDVGFALDKFEELWIESIDISEEYIKTIKNETWLKEDITPYELFLKTLYEYFKEEINEDKNEQEHNDLLPDGFMNLQYQTDAVIQAKKSLENYGGVFISDVVGLGKTYICAMLAQRLKGRKLIICPPVLKDYWERTLQQFDVSAKVESLGKLDSLLSDKDLMENLKYVFVDESHRFRNQRTESFRKLHEICFNKKVILVTATPLNNYSSDIANQIYLFQSKNNSFIIPNNRNLESFFRRLDNNLKSLDKKSEDYKEALKNNSEIIRNQVLRNIMVRRTRSEIMEFYKEDLERQGLKFPKLGNPEKIVYTYNDEIEKVFNYTIEIIQNLTYARYKPLEYLDKIPEEVNTLLVSQKNMSGFMKSILVKRLESSFEAFKLTLDRFITSYEKFLKMCSNGQVFISKKIDIYDLLDNGDNKKLFELVEEDIVQYFSIDLFKANFIDMIKQDLNLLKELQKKWRKIKDDPKIFEFLKEIKNNPKLMNKKIIIFTESKETAEYVGSCLETQFPQKVLIYSGQGLKSVRQQIEANYNPNYLYEKEDDIQFLVTTDVLAEGINLHRSNVLVNYDLPWNPTRVMQRVGRINRVGTEHNKIYVFNFFPATQANAHLTLEENIVLKIQAFHDTLGEDFKYLSDDEVVSSHSLYTKINSKSLYGSEEYEEVSELKYLKIIRNIRDNNEALFSKIKKLPQKSKTGKIYKEISEDSTLTFLRKGGLKKFYITNGENCTEISFTTAMKYLESTDNDIKIKPPQEFYSHLEKNKLEFNSSLNMDDSIIEKPSRSGNEAKIIKLIKAISKCNIYTEEEAHLLKDIRKAFEEGDIPPALSKEIIRKTSKTKEPLQIYHQIVDLVPHKYLEKRKVDKNLIIGGETKIILSEYLRKEG
ncbi:ATP-dependent helicase [Turicibacter faecis]|uniref:ATP-dependent helicase n=1 Tax=Turicibacter faecis TaxID=2963365 RepID=A0ABN6ZF80_9FIRM|nr:ATP-dependent helicase [Turicibacter sp. TC023]